jgi:endo-1,4-beta-D-glucanase Y
MRAVALHLSGFAFSVVVSACSAGTSPPELSAPSGGTSAEQSSAGGAVNSSQSTSSGSSPNSTASEALGSGGAADSNISSIVGGAAATTGGRSNATNAALGGKSSVNSSAASGGRTSTSATALTGGKSGAGGKSSTGVGGSVVVGGSRSTSVPPVTDGYSSSATETIPGDGCTPPSQYANLFIALLGKTQADTDAKIKAAWSALFSPSASGSIYKDGPAADESYVVDNYNNDARTEGMSYGMVIAVQLNHQTEFDRLWTFTKKHMVKMSGSQISEISWAVQTNGSPKNSGGAPDGDEYYAAALVFAHNRWGDTGKYKYADEAKLVLDLLRAKDFNSKYNLVKFYSGGDNGQTDASYILPAFYQTWACFDTANATFWNSAVTKGRAYFQAAANANGQYGDQGGYDGGSQVNTGVDKIRCVVNIMMDHNFFNADPWQVDTYAKKYSSYESSQNRSGAAAHCNATLGFGLPAASGKPFVDKLWSASVPTGSYWNGVLYMLALLHTSGTFRLYY